MQMDPELALDLSKNRKVQKLLKHILVEMELFNSIDDIKTTDPVFVTVEVKARKLAFEKMKAALQPLLDASEINISFNKDEYRA